LKQYGVEDSVALGSLQPSDLAKIHQVAPDIPMIVNEKPVFAEKTVNPTPFGEDELARINQLTKDEWTKMGAVEAALVDDEQGGETLLAQVPDQSILEFCKETGAKISVSRDFIMANIMEATGLKSLEQKADERAKKAVEKAHENGMQVQISTWLSRFGKIFGKVEMMEEIDMARKAGVKPDDIIYAQDAVGAAEKYNERKTSDDH